MKKLLAIAVLLIPLGCSSPKPSNEKGQYRVELYSGGEVVRVWETDDNVFWKASNGFAKFTDKATGKQVFVSGSMVLSKVD